MDLIRQINESASLQGLRVFLEEVKEIGIDPNDVSVLKRVSELLPEAMNSDFGETRRDFARVRSTAGAARELMRGAGIEDDPYERYASGDTGQENQNPRLGIKDKVAPAENELVMAAGGGIGKIVAVDGNPVQQIIVQTKDGQERVIQRKSLAGPKQTPRGNAWMEI